MQVFSKDFENLFADPAFQFIMKEASDRLEKIRNELEIGIAVMEVQTAEGVEEKRYNIDYAGLRDRQGECKSLRWLLNMPEQYKAILASKEEEEARKKKEESKK